MLLQSTLLGPLFWMLLGILQLSFFIGLRLFLKDKAIQLSRIKWGLVAVWWFSLNLTVAAGFTLIGENESRAGIYFLGFFGVIMLICGAALVSFIRKPLKSAGNK